MGSLYGDNLAAAIRPGITWDAADGVLDSISQALLSAYHSLSLWENFKAGGSVLDTANLAILQLIAPSDHDQAKALLDSAYADVITIRTMEQEQRDLYGDAGELPDDWVAKVKGIVSRGSSACALIDKLFHTSVAEQAADQIVPAVGSIGDKIGNAAAALVGNALGGVITQLWWAIGIAVLVLVFVPKARKAVFS